MRGVVYAYHDSKNRYTEKNVSILVCFGSKKRIGHYGEVVDLNNLQMVTGGDFPLLNSGPTGRSLNSKLMLYCKFSLGEWKCLCACYTAVVEWLEVTVRELLQGLQSNVYWGTSCIGYLREFSTIWGRGT